MLNELLERLADDGACIGRDGIGDGGETTKAEILAEVERLILAEREACAKVCDDADKSTHPADLADRIRRRSNAQVTSRPSSGD